MDVGPPPTSAGSGGGNGTADDAVPDDAVPDDAVPDDAVFGLALEVDGFAGDVPDLELADDWWKSVHVSVLTVLPPMVTLSAVGVTV